MAVRPGTLALASIALCAGALWWLALRPDGRLRVTFLDVGQGDSTVIESPCGTVVVVDTGPATATSDGSRYAVLPYLRSRGINRVDALILTHPDSDHTGGAATLLARIRVSSLLLPEALHDDPEFGPALGAARRRGVEAIGLSEGQAVRCADGTRLQVLNPPAAAGASRSQNGESLVVRLNYGRTSLLLMADADAETEAHLAHLPVTADVLKAGHHGSNSATSDALLDAVHARAAVISVGRRNRFGHPHRDVLARLDARGVRCFRTDQLGAISAVSDGRCLQITSMAGPAP